MWQFGATVEEEEAGESQQEKESAKELLPFQLLLRRCWFR
jgi:hypothetical protein